MIAYSAFWPSFILTGATKEIAGARSLSMIVTFALSLAIDAFDGFEITTLKLSSNSSRVSANIDKVTDLLVSPGLNINVFEYSV